MPPQQQYGHRGSASLSSGRVADPSAGGPLRLPAPDLHQASSQASSSWHSEDSSAEKFKQFFAEDEATTQAIQPVIPVSITPEVISRGVNRAVMRQLVRQYRKSYLGGRLPVYDGRKSLYTAGPLPFTFREFQIFLVDEDDGSGKERSGTERSFMWISVPSCGAILYSRHFSANEILDVYTCR
ncbi:hypothetical protein BHE74_00026242 [Ensete ventricosum]|nr:hypothetical protein GW17_00042991 [Ensete ventricosum]RWW66398.1 hypothetical protein BHE74_00026242 [Ensete ventricosum]RZS04178.1 hypothetical protein BHM03_00034471 [Ensete ventricosum]